MDKVSARARSGAPAVRVQIMNASRQWVLAGMRTLPRLRGHGRLAAAMNAWLLRAGAAPVTTTRMELGHRMTVDCRAQAQAWPLFTGQYDDGRIRILASLFPPGGCLLDAGASVGFYTVPLATVAQRIGGRVFAAEPFPANVARLRENLQINDLSRVVTVLPIGLSSKSGPATLVLREDPFLGATVGNASVTGDGLVDPGMARVDASLARLDDIWPTLGADRLDIAKIDVEGHEDQLLEGARETFARFRPVILMEVNLWYFRRRGVDFESAIREQLPKEYRFFRMTEPRIRLTTPERPRRLIEVSRIGAEDSEGLFLAPAEKVDSLHQAVTRARRSRGIGGSPAR